MGLSKGERDCRLGKRLTELRDEIRMQQAEMIASISKLPDDEYRSDEIGSQQDRLWELEAEQLKVAIRLFGIGMLHGVRTAPIFSIVEAAGRSRKKQMDVERISDLLID